MRIAHFGTFDVANFGDLLFPLVLERRLAGRGHVVTHVSPIGGPPVLGDCVGTIPVGAALRREFDGVIVGGGHLIHGRATDLAAYRAAGDGALFAYSDLWLGATRLACAQGASIVWNAPGVPGPFASETAALVGWAAAQADYLALRDATSRGFLEQASDADAGGPARKAIDVHVVLDTAIDVAGLWTAGELDAAWEEAFESRGCARAERAIALHFNSRFLSDGIESTAARLAAICREHARFPILLALGPCHGDDALVRELSAALDVPHLALDAPRSLRELVACLRGAELYVGSSLHGGISARAFDRPAILVAHEAPNGHRKHRSFLVDHARQVPTEAGRRSSHVGSWDDAFTALEVILGVPSSPEAPVGSACDPNAAHWTALFEALEADRDRVRARRREGAAALAALEAARWSSIGAAVGILLDQAREGAAHRAAAQRNAERFRSLERNHRDLRERLRSQQKGAVDVASASSPEARRS